MRFLAFPFDASDRVWAEIPSAERLCGAARTHVEAIPSNGVITNLASNAFMPVTGNELYVTNALRHPFVDATPTDVAAVDEDGDDEEEDEADEEGAILPVTKRRRH